jgi:hypothetical protein
MATTRKQLIRAIEAKLSDYRPIIKTGTPRRVVTIVSVAEGAGSTVIVTAPNHGFLDGNAVTQVGTTDYDDTYVISAVTDDTYTITATWVQTRTGTATDATVRGLLGTKVIDDLLKSYNGELTKLDPVEVIADITGAATKVYQLSTSLTGWDDEYSNVGSILYPYDATDEDPTAYDTDYWKVEKRLIGSSTVLALIMRIATPSASETIRVFYTTPHSFGTDDDDDTTVPDKNVDAFANLIAGHYIVTHIAGALLQSIDDTITADVVSAQTLSQAAQSVGLEYIKMFYTHFGVDYEAGETSGPASARIGWPTSSSNSLGAWYHELKKPDIPISES